MIDPEEYGRTVYTESPPEFIFGTKTYNFVTETNLEFSDEDTMTCFPFLPGFSLGHKRWGLFSVSSIRDVAYNDKAFGNLVLAEEKKKLISSLVMQLACQKDDKFDDLIQGKGKGLVFLLHGPPGAGKTYTAGS